MDDLSLWKAALSSVGTGVPAYLLVVVASSGSTPQKAGAKLLVTASGKCYGTIGGGAAEHDLTDMAQKALKAGTQKVMLAHQSHRAQANDPATTDSGMICSGNQSVALIPLGSHDTENLAWIVNTLDEGHPASLELSNRGLHCYPYRATHHSVRRVLEEKSEDDWSYEEPIGLVNTLYIFGGGHVSLALSNVMTTLGFRIVVFDDRSALPTMEINDFADEKCVVSYDWITDHVQEGPHSYVVIMTAGHQSDAKILAQLAGKDFHYLGMLGSRSKAKQLLVDLESKGLDREAIANIHSPIGLSIGSHTPEEIAVSIAAEIIQVKNRKSS